LPRPRQKLRERVLERNSDRRAREKNSMREERCRNYTSLLFGPGPPFPEISDFCLDKKDI